MAHILAGVREGERVATTNLAESVPTGRVTVTGSARQ